MKITDILTEQNMMLEMANLYPNRTGIKYVMYFGEVGGQHGPRIKISNVPGKFARDDNFTINVSKNPEPMTPPTSIGIKESELNKIYHWVRINYDDLMLLWQIHETGDAIELPDGNILDDVTILNRLKKV